MKLRLLSTIVLFVCSVTVFAQKDAPYITDYEVIYEAVYALDSTMLDKTSREDLYLYTGSQSSVFMNFNLAKAEEIKAAMIVVKKGNSRSVTDNMSRESHFEVAFYKDFQNQKVKAQHYLGDQLYEYEEPKPIEWEIFSDTNTLMGYQVQKAKTHFAGRDYIAWFTHEVPIFDGPYVFSGLPGLIIELFDTEDHYHFKMKSLDKLEEPKTWNLQKHSKKLTKEKFNEMRGKKVMDEVDELFHTTNENEEIIISMNGKRVTAGEYRRILKESGKLKNNPIERLE